MIKRQIDLKHHIDEEGRIIKTGNGVEIPAYEPMILFRGRDRLAIPLLRVYRQLCVEDGCNEWQLKQIDDLLEKFLKFSVEHSEDMKQPGVTRGL